MSPRAACRLETLGFGPVFDFVGGKAHWLAHGLPREGTSNEVFAGDRCDPDPPTCGLDTPLPAIQAVLDERDAGFCLVTSPNRVLLGRVRRSALEHANRSATAETVMEPGPSTVRPSTPAAELDRRLARGRLSTAVITRPDGVLLGIYRRARGAAEEAMPTRP